MQVSKQIIEKPQDTKSGAKCRQRCQKDNRGYCWGVQRHDQGLPLEVRLEHVHGHGENDTLEVKAVDEAHHETKGDACGEGRCEAEGHSVKDNGVGDTHGANRDQDNVSTDEKDAEDEGENKVEEEEPLDRQLQ